MPVIEGARYRTGAAAGVSGDTTGFGPYVNSSTATGGTPASGTAGFQAGVAEIGALAVAQGGAAAGKVFVNTNTKASPTWTVVGGQS